VEWIRTRGRVRQGLRGVIAPSAFKTQVVKKNADDNHSVGERTEVD
jgi:hypothetical protein